MSKIILSIAFSLFVNTVSAQSVGIGTTNPDTSAILQLSSTKKGFLPPRMTASQKNTISSPKSGLIIYITDSLPGLYIYNGSSWGSTTGLGNFVDLSTSYKGHDNPKHTHTGGSPLNVI